jgi:hypothetical protein
LRRSAEAEMTRKPRVPEETSGIAELATGLLELGGRGDAAPGGNAHPDRVAEGKGLGFVVGAPDRLDRGNDDDDAFETILLDRQALERVGGLRQDDIHVLAPADIEHGSGEARVTSGRDGLEDVAEVVPDRQLVHVHPDEAHLTLAVLAQGAQERNGSGATDGGDENGERLEHLRSGASGARNA